MPFENGTAQTSLDLWVIFEPMGEISPQVLAAMRAAVRALVQNDAQSYIGSMFSQWENPCVTREEIPVEEDVYSRLITCHTLVVGTQRYGPMATLNLLVGDAKL